MWSTCTSMTWDSPSITPRASLFKNQSTICSINRYIRLHECAATTTIPPSLTLTKCMTCSGNILAENIGRKIELWNRLFLQACERTSGSTENPMQLIKGKESEKLYQEGTAKGPLWFRADVLLRKADWLQQRWLGQELSVVTDDHRSMARREKVKISLELEGVGSSWKKAVGREEGQETWGWGRNIRCRAGE